MSDTSIRPKLQQPFLLDDPNRSARVARLRRIARLIAIAAATALAASVLITVAVVQWHQDRAHVQVLRDDLTRLIEAEQVYRETTGAFGDLDDLGANFVPSQAVWVDLQLSGSTWRAAARHERVDVMCWVEGAVGEDGVVACG
jgi:hypothetical protein